jgi:hypothetical protein
MIGNHIALYHTLELPGKNPLRDDQEIGDMQVSR